MHRRSLIAAALAGLPLAAARSQDFPTRPVRVVVGFPPGGGTDLVARPLAQKVQGIFGQSVVVDNRAGANGSVGLEVVAKSPPDGYTIGHVNSSVVVTNPLLYKNLAVNVERDLVPVCTVADSAVVLAVPADLPARDLRELVALAKVKPGQLNFGSGGLGSVDHLSFEVLKRQTGVEFLHVPYRGGGPALNDMIGGRVQLMISSYGMYKGQVDAGRVRIVVPTGVGQGWPDLIVPAWQGIVAPAQTPAAILDKVEAAYRSALADPEVKALLISLGYFPIFRGQKDAARMIRDETVRWGTIIRELGIQLD